MTTKLDTIITSQPVPKESDVDAPVRFPKKETEVARKGNKASRGVLDKWDEYEYTALERRIDRVSLGVLIADGVMVIPCGITAGALGGTYCGTTGAVLGGLSGVVALCVACGALSCVSCSTRGNREISKRYFAEKCGCIERCQVKRSQREESPELEEAIIDQPRAKSPSPEPEPAKGGWLNLSSWFAPPSEAKEPVDESSV